MWNLLEGMLDLCLMYLLITLLQGWWPKIKRRSTLQSPPEIMGESHKIM
jgi:hypothetical protein